MSATRTQKGLSKCLNKFEWISVCLVDTFCILNNLNVNPNGLVDECEIEGPMM